jgi:hypothetical protein
MFILFIYLKISCPLVGDFVLNKNLTDFWGEIKPTYSMSKIAKDFQTLLSQVLPLQMCIKTKQPEVSIMSVRGVIKI